MSDDMRKWVVIDYTNYRGERSTRTIGLLTTGIYFGSNEWHPEPQWLLEALDLEKMQPRVFAMKDIHSWRPAE
jgi:hypothetical protein